MQAPELGYADIRLNHTLHIESLTSDAGFFQHHRTTAQFNWDFAPCQQLDWRADICIASMTQSHRSGPSVGGARCYSLTARDTCMAFGRARARQLFLTAKI